LPKYHVGQIFIDKENDSINEILFVAPEIDYTGRQNYYVKVTETNEIGLVDVYFWTYNDDFFDLLTVRL
jgi:hypothetical protein